MGWTRAYSVMNFMCFWVGFLKALDVYRKNKTMTENKNKGGGEQNLTVSLIEYIETFHFWNEKKKIESSLNYLTPTLSIALTFYVAKITYH